MEVPPIAQRCITSFRSINQVEALLQRGCTNDDHTSPTLVAEMGRFRVWSENIAAHRRGRISLDYRLRQSSRMQKRAIGLLDDLIRALQETVLILSGKRKPYDADSDLGDSESEHSASENFDYPHVLDTEIASLSGEISDVVNYLYDLSIIIRSSAAPRDLLRKAGAIDLSHFQTWDIDHVKQKFPMADATLVERLGKANTRRRQVFRYLQNHHAKFSRTESRGNQERQLDRDSDEPSDHGDRLKRLSKFPTSSSAFASTAHATENTQTTVETFIESSPEVFVDDAPSETTSAASDGSELEGSLHLPDLPSNGLNGNAFECPYCFEIMGVSSGSSWRAHVLQDLQPYICTYADCKQASQTYGTRSRWFSHIADVHLKRWQCGYCQMTMSSKTQLEMHLHSEHCGEYSQDQLSAIADVSTTHTTKTMAGTCPLCLKEGQHLRSHLAKHMQTLALFVLPTTNAKAGEDVDSNKGVAWGSEEDIDSYVESYTSTSDESSEPSGEDDITRLDAGILVDQDSDAGSPIRQGRWADFDLQATHKGMAPLLSAASLGQVELVKLLVNEPGSNAEVTDNRGQTPLSRAAEVGASEVVGFLVTVNGINIDSRDRVFRRTPLSWAAGNGHTGVVQILLATSRVDVNAGDSYGRTSLWRAAGAGNAEIVRALLATPLIEPDRRDRYGRSPLSWAAAGNHTDVLLLLATVASVDVNSLDQKLVTPLSRAAAAGQLNSVRSLLRLEGVDINAKDETLSSPLSRAAEGGYVEIVRVLLERGAIFDDFDNQGKTPIMKAEEGRHEEVLQVLLEAGAYLDSSSNINLR